MKLFGDDLKITKDNGFYEQLKKIASKFLLFLCIKNADAILAHSNKNLL